MKKLLRKPENWQDFETLCKKLWGEIWECSEIKKNGRAGQTQHGVDVFGIPKGESSYYGIQCKGKDDYINAQLSVKEIDGEVKKALTFNPALKKFYIATTANKDSKIEEYVRVKNLESLKNNNFEIHLFSWEDIVELIDENRRTHDWYVKSIDFNTNYKVKLSFYDGLDRVICEPVFRKATTRYFEKSLLQTAIDKIFHTGANRFGPLNWRLKIDEDEFIKSVTEGIKEEDEEKFNNPQPRRYGMSLMSSSNYIEYNRSVCVVKIILQNVGSEVLEKYKVKLRFEGAVQVDTVNKDTYFLDNHPYKYNTHFKNKYEAEFKPLDDYLVQNDTANLDEICFKPYAEEGVVKIYWQLFSKNFEEAGELDIYIHPKLELLEEPLFVDNPDNQSEITKIRNKYEFVDTDFYGKIL